MFTVFSMAHFYPRPPSARRVLSSVIASDRLSDRPSVRLSRTTFSHLLFKNFSYQHEIWWDDTQYHRAERYLKWPCSANLCVFHGTLKLSMIVFTRSEGRHYRFNSLRISVINLNLVGWCTVTWSRLIFNEAMLGQFWRVPWNFEMG